MTTAPGRHAPVSLLLPAAMEACDDDSAAPLLDASGRLTDGARTSVVNGKPPGGATSM
jgi:hypothetical protein